MAESQAKTPRLDAGPTLAGSRKVTAQRQATQAAQQVRANQRTAQRHYRRAMRKGDLNAVERWGSELNATQQPGSLRGGGGGISQSNQDTGINENVAFANADVNSQIASTGDPNEKQGRSLADAPPAQDKGRTEGAPEASALNADGGSGESSYGPQESSQESADAIEDSISVGNPQPQPENPGDQMAEDNDYFASLPQTPRNQYIQNVNKALGGEGPINMQEIKRQGEAFGISGDQIESRYNKLNGLEDSPKQAGPSARDQLLAKKTAEVQARSDKRMAEAEKRDRTSEFTSTGEIADNPFFAEQPGSNLDDQLFLDQTDLTQTPVSSLPGVGAPFPRDRPAAEISRPTPARPPQAAEPQPAGPKSTRSRRNPDEPTPNRIAEALVKAWDQGEILIPEVIETIDESIETSLVAAKGLMGPMSSGASRGSSRGGTSRSRREASSQQNQGLDLGLRSGLSDVMRRKISEQEEILESAKRFQKMAQKAQEAANEISSLLGIPK